MVSHPFTAQEYFDFSTVLVLANRVVTCAVAAAVAAASRDAQAPPPPPLRAILAPCFLVAATNSAAAFCQYEALHFVSFAGVTLAKSAKMLPVLLWVRPLCPLRPRSQAQGPRWHACAARLR